ncbi:putative enzyme related to lactoylglutathione lyase [Allocatelliglobosispora scoriae]|uniref:Putative enzyme related to lactoylglutathione lyase n=1 Tax=Allocatelliglobosispora scoriae TaxID=643052 RepID=A0A841BJ52_9ACTN|nr:VOC family protein [Allocatelliglobosispora scoriae]MBB5867199.1 putative enzyme related to lactoylglutathione lyase [Allocatelliglobosispora scoriae]
MTGRVVHFEIPADDLARAQDFYREAFGWNIVSMPELQYTMVSTTPIDEQGMPTEPGAINGGMLARQSPITNPVITIDVEDMDAAIDKLERAGGTLVRKPQAVGTMGIAAYFTDPEGNTLGLWQTTSS